MIFLDGQSEYSNWSNRFGENKLFPHHTGYIVALDNRVYWRSCSWHNFNEGRWHVVNFENPETKESIEITPEQYINRPKGYTRTSHGAIYNHKDDPSYPSNKELEDMFNIEFEAYIKRLNRDFKLNSVINK